VRNAGDEGQQEADGVSAVRFVTFFGWWKIQGFGEVLGKSCFLLLERGYVVGFWDKGFTT